MNNTKTWSDPFDRPGRLKRLGLAEGTLLQAVEQGHAAQANCTLNHPPLHRGIVAWGETTRALRDGLIPRGWKRYDRNNQPFVVNEHLNIAITVATGTENTGQSERNPSTKSSKGASTESAVKTNLRITLFGDIRTEVQKKEDARQTWMLLFFRDEKACEIRCELSLPLRMNDDGVVDEWSERIILGPIPYGGTSVTIPNQPPEVPEIEIDVKRRRA